MMLKKKKTAYVYSGTICILYYVSVLLYMCVSNVTNIEQTYLILGQMPSSIYGI